MDKKIKLAIDNAKENMNCQEFIQFLIDLDGEDKIIIDYSSFDTVMDYTQIQAKSMVHCLNSGEWFSDELKHLNAIEDMPESEGDYIGIDAYGYPYSFENNEQILDELLIL